MLTWPTLMARRSASSTETAGVHVTAPGPEEVDGVVDPGAPPLLLLLLLLLPRAPSLLLPELLLPLLRPWLVLLPPCTVSRCMLWEGEGACTPPALLLLKVSLWPALGAWLLVTALMALVCAGLGEMLTLLVLQGV